MTPQEALHAAAAGTLGMPALFRTLFGHPGWGVPRPQGAQLPTVMVADATMTPSIWAFSTEDAYRAACVTHRAEVIGPISLTDHLDELLVEDDPRVSRFVIDPAGPMPFNFQADALALLRQFARTTRVERAFAARAWSYVRAFERYLIPYFGVLGQGHNLLSMNKSVAALTAADAVDALRAAATDNDRAEMKFITIDGDQLFTKVAPMFEGVVVNPFGPSTFTLDSAICHEIAGSR